MKDKITIEDNLNRKGMSNNFDDFKIVDDNPRFQEIFDKHVEKDKGYTIIDHDDKYEEVFKKNVNPEDYNETEINELLDGARIYDLNVLNYVI
jgi:hypothetical protein